VGRAGIAIASAVKTVPCILLAAMLFSVCSRESPNTIKSYPIRGEVVAIDSALSRITIAHHEIPGLMKAMTMAFKAKNPALLGSVEVGDSIAGRLVVSNHETYLDSLRVIRKTLMPNP
jgi:Cu/Ag efflux protein CusF